MGYDGRPGQSHRCVTRSAGAHPDPLTICGKDPPEGHSPRRKRGPSQGGGPSSSHQGSKPGGKNAPKPRLHRQFHPEADTVSPRGTMNPDFLSPMPPMAGDAEQLGKEGQGDQVLDRPECLPAFRVPHLTDRVAIVQLGFRSRPPRDGGGKTFPATLGALIMTLTRPWIDKVRMSLASGATTHPFQEADLEELPSLSGDPLKEGVPLEVSDPTLTSPGVWPTEEELKGEAWLGEDPPPPVAHDNYPTAELFAKEIESTFYEERALDMVDGPFTRSEAAERCRCKPEELCPGPLAGIDESDKIRTIYDGSKGGANAHIQAHTDEKTTAPMVGDCLHAIHQQHAGRDWVHHESQPGIDRGERRLLPRKRDSQRQKSGQDGCGVPVRPAASEDPAVVVHKD